MSETAVREQCSEDGSCSRGDGDHQSLILFTLRNRGVYLLCHHETGGGKGFVVGDRVEVELGSNGRGGRRELGG